MSDASTKKMIAMYNQEAAPNLFLSSFFKTPPENFFDSEKVEYDVERSDEDVSVAVQNVAAAYRENAHELFTNKEVTPAVHQEGAAITVFDMMKREAGRTTYDSPQFQASAIRKVFKVMRKMENKILRAKELQAAQLFTTGKVDLVDKNGNTMFEADFKPKVTHFYNASTAWDQNGADPLADIKAGCDLVRKDGLIKPDMMIMGVGSFELLIKNDDVLKRLDTRNLSMGAIGPMTITGEGGEFRGTLEVGSYRLAIYTYDAQYKDPQTGNKVPYIADDKVVIMSSKIRLDACFGSIPRFDVPDGATVALPTMPGVFNNAQGGRSLSVYAWFTPDRKTLTVEVGTRVVLIPTAIDQYVCLDTGI
jgi:hypothetical protein